MGFSLIGKHLHGSYGPFFRRVGKGHSVYQFRNVHFFCDGIGYQAFQSRNLRLHHRAGQSLVKGWENQDIKSLIIVTYFGLIAGKKNHLRKPELFCFFFDFRHQRAFPDQNKARRRISLINFRKHIQQENMVFGGAEASHMPDDKLAGKP